MGLTLKEAGTHDSLNFEIKHVPDGQ